MTELLGLLGAARDLGHGHPLEIRPQKRQQIAPLGLVHGAQGEFLAAAAGRNQADPEFDQADVAFQRRHHPVAVHQELAATTERQPLPGRHHRQGRIAQRGGGVLKLGDGVFDSEFEAREFVELLAARASGSPIAPAMQSAIVEIEKSIADRRAAKSRFLAAREPQHEASAIALERDRVAADLATIIDHYRRKWQRDAVVLIGYSFGADILPFAFNRLPEEQRQRVLMLSLLGFAAAADFEIHVTGCDNQKFRFALFRNWRRA